MSELIGLDEAKLHCRIDNDDSYEDAMIQAYIEASLEVCQKHIGKRFGAGLGIYSCHQDRMPYVRFPTVRIPHDD